MEGTVFVSSPPPYPVLSLQLRAGVTIALQPPSCPILFSKVPGYSTHSGPLRSPLLMPASDLFPFPSRLGVPILWHPQQQQSHRT